MTFPLSLFALKDPNGFPPSQGRVCNVRLHGLALRTSSSVLCPQASFLGAGPPPPLILHVLARTSEPALVEVGTAGVSSLGPPSREHLPEPAELTRSEGVTQLVLPDPLAPVGGPHSRELQPPLCREGPGEEGAVTRTQEERELCRASCLERSPDLQGRSKPARGTLAGKEP